MNHVNINAFYSLGSTMFRVASIAHGGSLADHEGLLRGTRIALGRFTSGEILPLARCLPMANKLDQKIDALIVKYSPIRTTLIKAQDRQDLVLAAVEFERELLHELANFDVYYIPPKGSHGTLALIEKAESNLPKEVVGRLEPKALNDIQQAGRCLALDAPTAAGFHILRAVESLIVAYINKITGKPHSLKNRNWGAYINAIRNGSGKPAVADYLYHMKETYRNPIMHPEVTLTPDEAFSLFNASLSAIVQLDKAIEEWP